ncbi:hypothetical protein H4R18_000272 [Coemansia javaensis]|uniref:Peptidase S1 domain-containing protein n=1 Tax=Coemansia javaensis TaxID=2761396 RepID=A0A9W8HHC2_9FUNG|nr:hypothetical protein H4R18_000272 [Coemansia javaensis]
MADLSAPYEVSVFRFDRKTGSGASCGGTLVSNRHVITAAHCLTNKKDPLDLHKHRVVIGYGSQIRSKQTQVEAVDAKIFPDYLPSGQSDKYDIAVVEIKPVEFGKTVQRMAIYDGSLDPGQKLLTVGWGGVNGGKPGPNALKGVTLVVGEPDECRKRVAEFDSSNGPRVCTLTDSTPGDGICMGDSGSSISIERNGKQQLVGLSSLIYFGSNMQCAGPGSMSLFTHVSYKLDFIIKSTGLTREYLLGGGTDGGRGDTQTSSGSSSKTCDSDNDNDNEPSSGSSSSSSDSDHAPTPSEATVTVTKTLWIVMTWPG